MLIPDFFIKYLTDWMDHSYIDVNRYVIVCIIFQLDKKAVPFVYAKQIEIKKKNLS